MGAPRSTPAESTYVVRAGAAPEAIANSLQALLPTRHRPISKRRFTVLDTMDGRVRRSGMSLTQSGSERSVAVVWQPRGSGSQLAVRVKRPVNFVWDLPSGPLQQALRPTIGVRRLLPQADAEEHGSLLEILDDQGKTVARLRIASGRARLPHSDNSWQLLPTVITLTGLRGYEEVYRQLVPVIQSRPGVESCPDGFHGVMLGLLGVTEAVLSTPTFDLAPAVSADVGARCILRALLASLIANEPGIRANLDTEFLHDFRVAVRRTRALLRQIKHVLPSDEVERFSTEFSWLGRLTGGPRDIDVLVLSLRDRRLANPDDDMAELTAWLVERQQQEYQTLVAALESDRYRQLLSGWAAFLDRTPTAGAELRNAERPLASVITERAWRLCQRIAHAAEAVDEQTPPEQLHEIRIEAKKLRYLIDVMSESRAPEHLDCVIRALKDLQRALGDFNDSYVQQQRLNEYGGSIRAGNGSEGAALAIERLAEARTQQRASLRADVVKALDRFGSRDTRTACRRAFRHQRDSKEP